MKKRTDSDSGIYSFGSSSSGCRHLTNGEEENIGEDQSSYGWRQNIMLDVRGGDAHHHHHDYLLSCRDGDGMITSHHHDYLQSCREGDDSRVIPYYDSTVLSRSLSRHSSKRSQARSNKPRSLSLNPGRGSIRDKDRRVSRHRLSMISSNHHLPRISYSRNIHPPSSSIHYAASDPDLYSSLSSLQGEEAISLAYIKNNMVIHKYIASRGQREKETDIYEVFPHRIFSHIWDVSVC